MGRPAVTPPGPKVVRFSTDETPILNSMRVGVKRKFDSLQYEHLYDDDLPVLHPTLITLKADLVLKVYTNDTAVARILLHKAHICDNIPYFDGMFRKQSGYREEAVKEQRFDCPYS